jgi:hypothetical protein
LRADTITDSNLGFTLNLPPGFVARPDLVGAKPDIVHAFQFGEIKDGDVPVLLLIEKMGGVINRERLTKQNMPSGFNGELFGSTWQGFDVDGIKVAERVNGIDTVTYNVQIPLKREAIQVGLFGRADHQEMLRPLLHQVLDGLNGKSNWLSSALPSSVANWQNYGMLLTCILIGGVIAGLVVLWFVSRSSPIGVLVIATALHVVAGQFADTRIRELRGLTGAMRMLGTAGIILGVFYLLRERKAKNAIEQSLARKPAIRPLAEGNSLPRPGDTAAP